MPADGDKPILADTQRGSVLAKLLGSLELQVMGFMWQAKSATVQDVTDAISLKRPIAYTTIMTIMVHLVDKGLLARAKHGKKYRYQVLLTEQEFIRDSARNRLHDLIGDFGDVAVAQFVEAVQYGDARKLEKLRSFIQERLDESTTTRDHV